MVTKAIFGWLVVMILAMFGCGGSSGSTYDPSTGTWSAGNGLDAVVVLPPPNNRSQINHHPEAMKQTWDPWAGSARNVRDTRKRPEPEGWGCIGFVVRHYRIKEADGRPDNLSYPDEFLFGRGYDKDVFKAYQDMIADSELVHTMRRAELGGAFWNSGTLPDGRRGEQPPGSDERPRDRDYFCVRAEEEFKIHPKQLLWNAMVVPGRALPPNGGDKRLDKLIFTAGIVRRQLINMQQYGSHCIAKHGWFYKTTYGPGDDRPTVTPRNKVLHAVVKVVNAPCPETAAASYARAYSRDLMYMDGDAGHIVVVSDGGLGWKNHHQPQDPPFGFDARVAQWYEGD